MREWLCHVCGCEVETIKHVFFTCEEGLESVEFRVGGLVPFNDWLDSWCKNVPHKSVVVESIIILWIIWCNHNNASYGRPQVSVQMRLGDVYQTMEMIKKAEGRVGHCGDGMELCGREGRSNGGGLRDVLRNGEVEASCIKKLVVDGAWRKETWEGAIAWCWIR